MSNVEDSGKVIDLLNRLHGTGVNPEGIAFGLMCFDAGSSTNPLPELVWTGPKVPGLHTRATRKVFEGLFQNAEHSLWISTYAFFDGPKAFEVLAARMDQMPNLAVTLLLNIQRRKGDKAKPEILVRRFANRFWTHEWPGSRRPRVFFEPRSIELNGATGVLHAKGAVADERFVFLTSANLTEAAFDYNIELGVHMDNPPFAKSVVHHFRRLIEDELLMPLPQV